jgi:threonine aldolase
LRGVHRFNSTAANSLALSSLCQSYHSFLCHETAHIETSECGAPEFFAIGSKILLLAGANGKTHPPEISSAINKRPDIHYPKPRALSIGSELCHNLAGQRSAKYT